LKDAFYFPHFSNARHDRKIKRMSKELGIEGYGIFFMLLEVLRDQIDFKYPVQDIDLLADEFCTSEQKIKVVICNYQLFEVDENERFFSTKFDEYMQPYQTMKEQRRIAGIRSGEVRKEKQLERSLNGCSTDAERMLNENEQKKGKESKGNETKVKERKRKETKVNTYSDDFESWFKRYPRAQSKEDTYKSWCKLIDIGKSVDFLNLCLDNYIDNITSKQTEEQFVISSNNFLGTKERYLEFTNEKTEQQSRYRRED